jgi:hypothetical protein
MAKYATIQFSPDSLERVKQYRDYLNSQLGLNLSLQQAIIYAINGASPPRLVKRKES